MTDDELIDRLRAAQADATDPTYGIAAARIDELRSQPGDDLQARTSELIAHGKLILNLQTRIEEMHRALAYIAQPTMGYNPAVETDPATFALAHANDKDVRNALVTCIRLAAGAIHD